MEDGRRLDGPVPSRMRALLGLGPRDIRVHDSRQAADLAGRLSGEVFTMGEHDRGSLDRVSTESEQMVHLGGGHGPAGNSVQRQVMEPVAQRADETATAETESPDESSGAPGTGPEAMANMVYRMMMRDLVLERERRA